MILFKITEIFSPSTYLMYQYRSILISLYLATSCEELTHWKRLWCWEGLGAVEKGTTEHEMAGWHHRLDSCEFEWTPGVGDGQEAWCAVIHGVTKSWTQLSNWTELISIYSYICVLVYITRIFETILKLFYH